jgi:hypothetical protein
VEVRTEIITIVDKRRVSSCSGGVSLHLGLYQSMSFAEPITVQEQSPLSSLPSPIAHLTVKAEHFDDWI